MFKGKGASVYLAIIIILIGVSSVVSYYRYMVWKEFTYYTDESQVPDQFSPATYGL